MHFCYGFEMKYCSLFNMVLPHATWTIGGWHVGVRNMHDFVLGNFTHPHCFFVLKTILALGGTPSLPEWGASPLLIRLIPGHHVGTFRVALDRPQRLA